MELERDIYKFIGNNAEESVKYYDKVVSFDNISVDRDYIAWDAAHKFGSHVIGPGMASFRDGMVYGEKAVEAATFLDDMRGKIYGMLPEYNRGNIMRLLMPEIMDITRIKFDVTIITRYSF